MKALFIVALSLSMISCGIHKTYSKPDGGVAQMESDLKECKYEADKATQCITYPTDPAEAAMFRGDERERLTQGCMEAKGYATGKAGDEALANASSYPR
jgi:hypothetical protein